MKQFITIAIAFAVLAVSGQAQTTEPPKPPPIVQPVPRPTTATVVFKPIRTLWTSAYESVTVHFDEEILRTQYFTEGYVVFDLSALKSAEIISYKLSGQLNMQFTPDEFGPFHDLLLLTETSWISPTAENKDDPFLPSDGTTFWAHTTYKLGRDGSKVTFIGNAAAAAKFQRKLLKSDGRFAFVIEQEFGPDAWWKFIGFYSDSLKLTVTYKIAK